MKKRLSIPVLSLALVTGYGVGQQAQDDVMAQQVDALTKRVEAVEGYLQAQAKAMQASSAAVDLAVEQGFTSGINFESRQTLVKAWQARAKAAGVNVPGVKEAKQVEPIDPRLKRRGR